MQDMKHKKKINIIYLFYLTLEPVLRNNDDFQKSSQEYYVSSAKIVPNLFCHGLFKLYICKFILFMFLFVEFCVFVASVIPQRIYHRKQRHKR